MHQSPEAIHQKHSLRERNVAKSPKTTMHWHNSSYREQVNFYIIRLSFSKLPWIFPLLVIRMFTTHSLYRLMEILMLSKSFTHITAGSPLDKPSKFRVMFLFMVTWFLPVLHSLPPSTKHFHSVLDQELASQWEEDKQLCLYRQVFFGILPSKSWGTDTESICKK